MLTRKGLRAEERASASHAQLVAEGHGDEEQRRALPVELADDHSQTPRSCDELVCSKVAAKWNRRVSNSALTFLSHLSLLLLLALGLHVRLRHNVLAHLTGGSGG